MMTLANVVVVVVVDYHFYFLVKKTQHEHKPSFLNQSKLIVIDNHHIWEIHNEKSCFQYIQVIYFRHFTDNNNYDHDDHDGDDL